MRALDLLKSWAEQHANAKEDALAVTRKSFLDTCKSMGEPTCRSCKRAACCYQVVPIALIEAADIAYKMHNHGKNTKSVRKRMFKHAEQQRGIDRLEWFERAIPCPFLKGNRCEIYPFRPSSCFLYYVWTENALCTPTKLMTKEEKEEYNNPTKENVCGFDFVPYSAKLLLESTKSVVELIKKDNVTFPIEIEMKISAENALVHSFGTVAIFLELLMNPKSEIHLEHLFKFNYPLDLFNPVKRGEQNAHD